MAETKYVRQRGGLGHYAYCKTSVCSTDGCSSIVVDKCSWEIVKSSYSDAFIHSGLISWKQSVLNGMEYALRHIIMESSLEFDLLDVSGLMVASTGAAMFTVGLLSIFNELKIDLSQEDLDMIDDFVHSRKGPQETFGIVGDLPKEIGTYR